MTSSFDRRAGRALARSVLDLATGAGQRTGPRGAESSKRVGQSFEDLLEAVLAPIGQMVRGHPASKVVRRPEGLKTIYTAKNGVDFVGIAHRMPLAIEAKALPGAASLRGGKNDSTVAEAKWLLAFLERGGCGGFLVLDEQAARIYVIDATADLRQLAAGALVPLRTREGLTLRPAVSTSADGRADPFRAAQRAVRLLTGEPFATGREVQGSAPRSSTPVHPHQE